MNGTVMRPGTAPEHLLAPRGSRQGGVKLLVVVLLAAALGLGAGYAVFGRQKAPTTRERAEDKMHAEEAGGEEDERLQYVNLGSFLVNLASNDAVLRYLRVEITLGVKGLKSGEKEGGGHGAAASKDLTLTPADDAVARDAIVRVLSSQSFHQLRQEGPRAQLKKLLTDELSHLLKDCKVVTVLFTSMTIQ